MRRYLIAAALALSIGTTAALAGTPAAASAACYVDGYSRANGTYVSGHYRSCPDSSTSNNWSSSGNTNPYTGERGYRNPYGSSYPYGPTYPSNRSYRSYWP